VAASSGSKAADVDMVPKRIMISEEISNVRRFAVLVKTASKATTGRHEEQRQWAMNQNI